MDEDPIAREQIKALDRRVTDALASQKEAVLAALSSAEKAVTKAEHSSDAKFGSVNEFRQTLSDQAHTFITRKEVEGLLLAVNVTLHRLENQGATMSGRGSGADYLWRVILAAGGAVAAVIAFFMGGGHR